MHPSSVRAAVVTCVLLTGCSQSPPENPDNICSVFAEHKDWYEAAKAMERQWGTPVSLAMAFIRQESDFTQDVAIDDVFFRLSPRGDSSAPVGYTQAQDLIWQEYEAATDQSSSRTSFADSLDFLGWYTSDDSTSA